VRWRVLAALALVVLFRAATQSGPRAAVDVQTLSLSADLRIRVGQGRELELEARPLPGEGWEDLSTRLTGRREQTGTIRSLNGEVALTPEQFVRVPLSLLADEYRVLTLTSLFPSDRLQGDAWVHVARGGRLSTYGEGLWQVAEWFAGDGSRFEAIANANGLVSPELAPGQVVRVPLPLLHGAFKPKQSSDDGLLVYGEDALGSYGGYRLQPGEAMYSAVVVRFTGRTAPDDVNDLTSRIARRNGIRDVKDIPAGFLVKIPLDLLEPEYLPKDHPRHREEEAVRRELDKALTTAPRPPTVNDLKDVLVIIDPGHGGRDRGTIQNGVSEHEAVLDVACRLKARLEAATAARVTMTLQFPDGACKPSSEDLPTVRTEGEVATNPPYPAGGDGETSIGVHLRWYLSNAYYREALKSGIASNRVVFVSVHADSRHPSLRGLMVYVPGASFRGGVQGKADPEYERFAEARERPTIRFSHKERVRSEAVSRRLAERIVRAFRDKDLPVQPYKPIRDRVIRGDQTWLPAVLRGNAVPAKVLVEIANLSNPQDASALATARQRERVAGALGNALIGYLGGAQSVSARSSGSRR
jgi:N-acetylmuramoyl-L-alanine amidase